MVREPPHSIPRKQAEGNSVFINFDDFQNKGHGAIKLPILVGGAGSILLNPASEAVEIKQR